MKLTAILLFALSFSQCGSLKLEDNPPFKVTKATYKNWVGGQPGASGVNVFIKYTSENKIDFDSIYFMNRVVKVELNNVKGNKTVVGRFNTSSVNARKDIVLHENATKEIENKHPKQTIPFQLLNNEAVVSYRVNNKIKYYKILNLKKEESLFFPSMERK